MNIWKRICIGATAACVGAFAAQAHEMFLRPTEHFVAPDTETTIALFNGTFAASENPIVRDRMNDVSVVANGITTHPDASLWKDDEKTSYLTIKTGAAGTYAIGVSTKAKMIELSADDFEAYLLHDGIEDTLKARVDANVPRDPVKERYSKHVRTVLQVGDTQSGDFGAALGYPVEILLQQNPSSLKPGDTLSFKVLYKGEPLANQLVYSSYEGHHGHDDNGGHTHAFKMRTDAEGMASFTVDKASNWYVTLIHMEKLEGDAEADYESNWATVTFAVR